MKRNLLAFTALALTLLPGMALSKTLVFCSEGSPDTFSPMLSTSQTTEDAVRPIYNRLVQFKLGTTELVPALAEKWDIAEDGMSVTFHLRRNVKWHSNKLFKPTRDFNADDVLFTFERQWKDTHPYHNVSGGSYQSFSGFGLPSLLKGITAIDPYTVRFDLNRPNASFLANIATDFASIESAEYGDVLLKQGKPELLDQEPIGTGPFVFVDYRKNSTIRYRIFDDYWGTKPKLTGLVFSINTDAAVRLAKLRANECQIMAFPNISDLGAINQDPQLALVQAPGLNSGYIAPNTRKKPFDDKRVRLALNMAIDKKAILDNVYKGVGVPARNLIPPGLWGYHSGIESYPHDPAGAKKLLAEAGYPDGLKVDLWAMPVQRPYNPDGRRMAELVQSDLAAIGVQAQIVSFEWGEYLKRMRQGEHQLAEAGWTNTNGDPDDFFMSLATCDAAQNGANQSKWCNEEFDRLIHQAALVSDRAEREKLYKQAQQIMHDEAPLILLAHAQVSVPMRKSVSGFQIDLFAHHEFSSVELN